MISYADSKATSFLTIHSIVLGSVIIFLSFDPLNTAIFQLKNESVCFWVLWGMGIITFIVFVVFVIISIGNTISVIVPDYSGDKEIKYSEFFFSKSIIGFEDGSKYWNEFSQITENELMEGLASQIIEISNVLDKKFEKIPGILCAFKVYMISIGVSFAVFLIYFKLVY